MEFIINYPSKELITAVDFCGGDSVYDVNKFEKMRLTPKKAGVAAYPAIDEPPINIECKVLEINELGLHDMFITNILNIQVADNYIDAATNSIKMNYQDLIAFTHVKYVQLGNIIEQAGLSIRNKQ